MSTMASQITGVSVVYPIVYSCPDQRKLQSPASLTFVRGIHRGPVNPPHKGPVTRKMFPLDDVIMLCGDGKWRINNSISIRPSKRFRIHFTLGRSGKLSKQAALWKGLSKLMVNAHFLMQFNRWQVDGTWWNTYAKLEHDVIIFNFFFVCLGHSSWNILHVCCWDTTGARRIPWGYDEGNSPVTGGFHS